MGRGNFYAHGELADQWYIDYDMFKIGNQVDESHKNYMLYSELKELIQKRFPSFVDSNARVSKESYSILENELFYIGLADNEWSVAVFIQSKDDGEYYGGIAGRHFNTYVSAIKDMLLDIFGVVYIRTSAWTSGEATRQEAC